VIEKGSSFCVGLRSFENVIGPAAGQVDVLRVGHIGKREGQRQPGRRDLSEFHYHF
jgi:hypothetical protein